MPRATFNVTKDWQQVASAGATATIVRRGTGTLFFNEAATDVNALGFLEPVGGQFVETESLPMFVRSNGENWIITVSGVL